MPSNNPLELSLSSSGILFRPLRAVLEPGSYVLVKGNNDECNDDVGNDILRIQ
jgi:hypothetical protein